MLSNRGFSLVEVLLAVGLMVTLSLGMTYMTTMAQKASKGSELNQEARFLADKINQIKEDNLTCGCNFNGQLIDKTNPNHEITGLNFQMFSGNCSTPGTMIAQAGTDIASGLQLSDVKLANFIASGGDAWFADLVLSFAKANQNSLGSAIFERRIPIVLNSQIIDAVSDQITGCASSDPTATPSTTRFRARRKGTNKIHLTPGDGSGSFTARFVDGKVREFAAPQKDYTFSVSNLDNGGPIIAGSFYYLYAIPDGLDDTKMDFIASSNPPPTGPAGNQTNYYYITAFRAVNASGQIYDFATDGDRVHLLFPSISVQNNFRIIDHNQPLPAFDYSSTDITITQVPTTARSVKLKSQIGYIINPSHYDPIQFLGAWVKVEVEQRFHGKSAAGDPIHPEANHYYQYMRDSQVDTHRFDVFELPLREGPNKKIVHSTRGHYKHQHFAGGILHNSCKPGPNCAPQTFIAQVWVHGWTDPLMNQ